MMPLLFNHVNDDDSTRERRNSGSLKLVLPCFASGDAMGSQPSYQRLPTSVEDEKKKTHQLSKTISHFCWCAVVVLTLLIIVLILACRQGPKVNPEINHKLLNENSELQKEISALKANITSLEMEMEVIGKEKAKLGKEGQALQSKLVDTMRHLEEARRDIKDLHRQLDAINQTLSKTQKQLEESTMQDQTQGDLELANRKLQETLSQRDSCHTQLEEKIKHCNAESKNQQAVNEKQKEEIERVQQQLQNVLRDRSKCQDNVKSFQVQLKSASHDEDYSMSSFTRVAIVGIIIIIIIACIRCCE